MSRRWPMSETERVRRSRPQPLLAGRERERVEAIARLAYCNPFTPARLTLERQALGDAFTPFDVVWHAQIDLGDNPNVPGLTETARELAEALRDRLAAA